MKRVREPESVGWSDEGPVGLLGHGNERLQSGVAGWYVQEGVSGRWQ